MRFGVIWEPASNAHYRAIDPMRAMERRGHDVVWPRDNEGAPDLERQANCDVVHMFRRSDEPTLRAIRELSEAGVAVTYDNDVDLTAIPKESRKYQMVKGVKGQRLFTNTIKAAHLADAMTTTTDELADKYAAAGVKRPRVIDNYLNPELARPRARAKGGIVIGWIAAHEHVRDAQALHIREALKQILAAHADVRVECIGVDLRLSERYRHDDLVLFAQLPERTAHFSIGIAPLADIPYNRMRSSIKVKEYAASGVPWLASPVGPYLGLGEREGGRLVPDGGWFDALDRLVVRGRERKRLARSAEKWAKTQTMDSVAGAWEAVFVGAFEATRARKGALRV